MKRVSHFYEQVYQSGIDRNLEIINIFTITVQCQQKAVLWYIIVILSNRGACIWPSYPKVFFFKRSIDLDHYRNLTFIVPVMESASHVQYYLCRWYGNYMILLSNYLKSFLTMQWVEIKCFEYWPFNRDERRSFPFGFHVSKCFMSKLLQILQLFYFVNSQTST